MCTTCVSPSQAWNVLALDGSNWQKIDLFNFQTDIEGRVVENISKRCGGFLRQLSLRGCLSVGDASMKTFAQNCRNIEVLNLNGCTKITDSTCLSLSKFCSKLKQLDLTSCVSISNHSLKALSNITDASLTAMGLNCPRLKILEAARCSHVTDAGFTVLARNCHELEKMDLEECILVTDNTLVQLSIHCPRLQALSLSHCELITDDGIRALSSSTCGQERLTVVELDNCPLITDVTLEHLKSCHRLERIELYDCQQVTRAGIKRIRWDEEIYYYSSAYQLNKGKAMASSCFSHHIVKKKGETAHLPEIKVHAYFAPVTPPPSVHGGGQRLCRCCIIL
ncbi:F-box/LRR-repeat protein 20 [Nibea albiflora]|uniref:F-box/LRR-repeat protein 20 n=1 Tax=Nibea albiflora TaxID=240163 RepID=A0ACB7ESK6_NIBAL|nr:F-box/LRR-repeat protein 20 [Nibea albiflora]